MKTQDRILEIARCIAGEGITVREAAERYGLGKSTVHTYMTKKLPYLDMDLYRRVRQIMEYHFSVKHLRGGESTRRHYARRSGKSD